MFYRDHTLLIHKAVAAAGGEDKLRMLLRVSWPQLQAWLDARSAVPTDVFLKLVDLLEQAPEPAEPALHPFLAPDYAATSREQVCEAALDAALCVTGSDLGNVQLLDASGVLRICAQRGFEQRFLEFFAEVKGAESACGVALILGRQYSVPDVQAHPVFRGTAAGDVMLSAGAHAVDRARSSARPACRSACFRCTTASPARPTNACSRFSTASRAAPARCWENRGPAPLFPSAA